MPALDHPQDAFDDHLDGDNNDTGKQKNGKGKENSKVSHIPCKFYKAGACAAGQSCIFSHTTVERGQKEPCSWFVKGNCKFGHKCALAHVLPGQPMSMDRKNKKAAQVSNANSRGERGSGKQPRGGLSSQREAQQEQESTGSHSQRASRQLQGNISATAPPPTTPKQTDHDSTEDTPTTPTNVQQSNLPPSADESYRDTKPVSSPTPALPTTNGPPPGLQRQTPHRFTTRNQSSDLGYGPIGSPPQAGIRQGGLSHFSPGTSPAAKDSAMLSTSPFGQNKPTSLFTYGDREMTGNRTAPISSSFAHPITIGNGSWRNPDNKASAIADSDNDDMEEFLPSSLTDLLTPEEKQRRLSRSGGTRPGAELSHRYSRSVPAAGLLDNPAWMNKDRNNEISTPSMSFRSGFGSEGPSSLTLATSNASGAFLPHYRKPPQQTQYANPSINRQPFSQSFELEDRLLGLPTTNANTGNLSRLRGDAVQQPQAPMGGRLTGGLGVDTLSPTSRALHYHAPGQSLPQGLAAGLSRLHLKPTSSQLGGLPEEGDRTTRMYDPYIRTGTSPYGSGGLSGYKPGLHDSGPRKGWVGGGAGGGNGYDSNRGNNGGGRSQHPFSVAEDEDVFQLSDDEK